MKQLIDNIEEIEIGTLVMYHEHYLISFNENLLTMSSNIKNATIFDTITINDITNTYKDANPKFIKVIPVKKVIHYHLGEF